MRLFQYWDSGDPPDDVAACIQSVRDLSPEFEHELFDRDQAAWFIGKRLGDRERAAFLSLAVPAMQGDYFRLCALWARGGLWVDADCRAVRPLRKLLVAAPTGFITMYARRLQNSLILEPAPHSPFFRAAVELATGNIEARIVDSAYHITGPEVLNRIWAVIDPEGAHEDPHLCRHPDVAATPQAARAAEMNPGAAAAFGRLLRRHDFAAYEWVKEIEDLAYKATPRDWRRWRSAIYLP